ncbi:MAG: arylsulfatase family protein [Acidimicrobiales bacterium]|nr:arylsulfatase family protein [Acidimicrobiales bacterium]
MTDPTHGTRVAHGARPPFEGTIGRTFDDSTPWWPALPSAPEGAPNVVVVLLDDVGYGQFGCFGSDIATPTFDRLAAHGRRYGNFHTTALCSPTRAALLTGRNHHSNGMARVVELAAGFPGYNSAIPKENGFLSEVLVRNGYATFAVGKWHLTPATEMTFGSPRDKWPLGRGFERFYGFLGGETDQYRPDLVYDNHPIEPPRSPEDGYHLTEDLADRAIGFVKDLRAAAPEKPFFLWFTPGAAHAPHQAPASSIDAYRGQFDQGWDRWREEVFERQLASGLFPSTTELSERPSWVPAWDALSDDERRLYARMMEVYAGFLTHTDAQVGRMLDFLDGLGELDDTLVLLMSDNGASAEGGPRGSFNEQYFFNFVPESLEENLRRIDDLGTPRANNHYPWGWAWAGNTPLKRFKRDTHEGGVADPLIVHWPTRLGTAGGTRHQYVHAVDIAPTVLDLLGIEAPDVIAGIEQAPIEGISFAGTLDDADAASAHVTQYYEMLGSRALYHDGWKAVVFHSPPFLAYDGTDTTKPFDDDVWELYRVSEDFAEVHDLAASEPEKLAELQALWWSEAERFQVLPLNNQPGRFVDPRHRRDRQVFYAGVGPLPEAIAPALKNRSFAIAAHLHVPEGDGPVDGVLVAHGGHAGGYVLHIRGRRLHYTYNFVGTEITTVSASIELPPGVLVARVVATHRGTPGGPVDIALFYDDVPVGQGTVPHTTLLTYGTPGFAVGYQPFGPIDPDLEGRATIPDGVLGTLVVEAKGRDAVRDAVASSDSDLEDRADLATQ